jgi:hypothetical protein
MGDVPDDMMTDTAPRYTRRLSDKILIAFHQACDQADFEVAGRLLNVLETMTAALRLSRAPRGGERFSTESGDAMSVMQASDPIAKFVTGRL